MHKMICKNLEQLKERVRTVCEKTGRDPAGIHLVAVSKLKPNSAILAALDCGQFDFGENRARELQQKMDQIDKDEICWHFVGPMQTNKIKYMVERVDWIQSIYKKKYHKEIEKRASRIGKVINTLVQVNISGEDQKQGCMPGQVSEILEHAQSLDHVRVRGLMGMATYAADPDQVRGEFKLLKETFEKNQRYNGGSVQLEHLSMGMSNDLEVAIEEGSTMIRVGTAIFGEREYE